MNKLIYKIIQLKSMAVIYAMDTFINGLKNFFMGAIALLSCILIIPLSPFYSFLPGEITWGMAYKSGISGLIPNIRMMLFGLLQIVICPFSILIRFWVMKKLAEEQNAKLKAEEKERKKEERRRKRKGLPPAEFEGMTAGSTEFYTPRKDTPNVI